MSVFKLMNTEEFKTYAENEKVTRKIKYIQLHHTWSPSYAQFKGDNYIAMQQAMKDYHVNTKKWSDIAQNLTIFPDGMIVTGRSLNTVPAGINGANTNGICIECVGNFDDGGDIMSVRQRDAIVEVTAILLDRFSLAAESAVTYHSWWASGGRFLGDYIEGQSVKSCPGTNFFGGSKRSEFEKNLLPLLNAPRNIILESANDITWELNHNYFPITEQEKFLQALKEAREANSPLYWGYYKLVNKIK